MWSIIALVLTIGSAVCNYIGKKKSDAAAEDRMVEKVVKRFNK